MDESTGHHVGIAGGVADGSHQPLSSVPKYRKLSDLLLIIAVGAVFCALIIVQHKVDRAKLEESNVRISEAVETLNSSRDSVVDELITEIHKNRDLINEYRRDWEATTRPK